MLPGDSKWRLLHVHGKCLADLVLELRAEKEEWWRMRLRRKISDMKTAIVALCWDTIKDRESGS